MPTGTRYQRSPRTISDTSTVRHSHSWVMLKMRRSPTLNSSDTGYDNIYHNGRFIGDLPARGKPPTEQQSMKVYTQEYQEVVARVENSLDLMEESPSYSVVPTSLVNPDIVLPHSLFWERRGLPEIPPGRNPEPREYEMDGARGLIDLD